MDRQKIKLYLLIIEVVLFRQVINHPILSKIVFLFIYHFTNTNTNLSFFFQK